MAVNIQGDNSAASPGLTGSDTDTGVRMGTNELSLVTGGTNQVNVDSAGNVGIGTDSPTKQLQVHEGDSTASEVKFSNTTTGATLTDGFDVGIGADEQAQLWQYEDNYMRFATNNDEKMRITSIGSVGIGTTSPQKLADASHSLHVASDSASETGYLTVSNSDNDNFISLFSGHSGSQFQALVFHDDDHFSLGTWSNITGSSWDEKMRMRNNGRLIVGNGYTVDYGGMLTAVDESSDGTYFSMGRSSSQTNNVYSRDGTGTSSFTHIGFANTGGQRGSIVTNGSSTTYNTTSDYRIKENVVTLTGAIDRVKQLAPKRFNFIGEEVEEGEAPQVFDGFLAHEAQTVVPEAVTGEKDAVDANDEPVLQGIDQSKLVPLLTAALQEAITKIETLETKVAALEGGS